MLEYKHWGTETKYLVSVKEGEYKYSVGFIVKSPNEDVNLYDVFRYYLDKFSDSILGVAKRASPSDWTITVGVYEGVTKVWLETNAQFVYKDVLSKFVEMIGVDYHCMTRYIDENRFICFKYTFWLEDTNDFEKYQKDDDIHVSELDLSIHAPMG